MPTASNPLSNFLHASFARGPQGVDSVRPLPNVTALIYFFWTPEEAAAQWPDFAGALFETWRHCGPLKTVVVTNASHLCVVDFAQTFPHVSVQVEPSLIPGDINSMSADCNARLHTRFETDFVLIVQNDGFPLQSGLERFVSRGYDFIGAPYCRPNRLWNLLTRVCNFCPSNGGFSLRSKRLCARVAELWEKGRYAERPLVVKKMSEDMFWTMTLPLRSPRYWLSRRQAPYLAAA